MASSVTPEEIQSAMAVYASDDETRLQAGGDETEIVALTDGATHRVAEIDEPDEQRTAVKGTDGQQQDPPAFPI